MQRYVHLVDLVESFPTSIYEYLQNLASIQPRTSPQKFQISFPSRQLNFISVSPRTEAFALDEDFDYDQPCATRRETAPDAGFWVAEKVPTTVAIEEAEEEAVLVRTRMNNSE